MDNLTNNPPLLDEDNYSDHSTNDPTVGIIVYTYFFERQIIAAIAITACIIGTFDNSLVIVAVALSKKLRITTNVFVVNLAVADLLTCLFLPVQVLSVLGVDDWPIPDAEWLCVIGAFVVITTLGCRVNSLSLIAINRWIAITKYPQTTRRIYTSRKLTVMVCCSWAIPLCCALVPVLTVFGELGYNEVYRSCSWSRETQHGYYYALFISIVNYPLQLIVITFSYGSIFSYVRKTSRNMAKAYAPSISAKVASSGSERAMKRKLRKRQLAVTKNLVYIVLAFFLCFTPYGVSVIFQTDWSHRMVPWSALILACNSFVNPIIYATTHPYFREAFRCMARCHSIPRNN